MSGLSTTVTTLNTLKALKISGTGTTTFPAASIGVVVGIMAGGGGGSGYYIEPLGAVTTPGSGGVAGNYIEITILKSGSSTISYSTGIGGDGKQYQNGNPGGDTSITYNGITITANGGNGGKNGQELPNIFPTENTTRIIGSYINYGTLDPATIGVFPNGGNGSTNYGSGPGALGGAGIKGNDGTDGSGGGGGGVSGTIGNYTSYSGGKGGDGYIILRWF